MKRNLQKEDLEKIVLSMKLNPRIHVVSADKDNENKFSIGNFSESDIEVVEKFQALIDKLKLNGEVDYSFKERNHTILSKNWNEYKKKIPVMDITYYNY